MFQYQTTFSSFSVNDLAEAMVFYHDKLGLDVRKQPEGLAIELADGGHVFIYEKPDHEPASFTVLNFKVDNIDESLNALIACGVGFERYDSLPARQDDMAVLRGLQSGDGPDIAWFKDPAGNVLSLVQGT